MRKKQLMEKDYHLRNHNTNLWPRKHTSQCMTGDKTISEISSASMRSDLYLIYLHMLQQTSNKITIQSMYGKKHNFAMYGKMENSSWGAYHSSTSKINIRL